MPMGGGSFTLQNKILPGAYINFVSTSAIAQMGTRGVAALPLELNWGPDAEVFSIESAEFNKSALKVFGYDALDDSLLLVREALKRAATLLIYRVNGGGTKATVTVGGMTVTAKYGGTRGNDIKVAVVANVDDENSVDVITYLDGQEVDKVNMIEINTTPGMTATSFIPQQVKAAGLSMTDVLTDIVENQFR